MEYNYFGKEQKVYYEKLNNGLDVYIVPNKNIKTFSINYIINYGSDIKSYIPINKSEYTDITAGLAHFLEHKNFDMEENDAFDVFAKYGAYTNAATSNEYTKYYAVGKKYFKKCLETLTNLVFSLYVTDYTVEKEIDIISEEINMYNDEPDWQLEKVFRESFYQNILSLDIAGSKDSISKITREKLVDVFETFYQPSNAFLIITGNVKVKEIINILNSNTVLNRKVTNKKITYKKVEETKKVVLEYQKVYANIIYPKIEYGFKFDLNDFTLKDYIKKEFYLNAIFTILFGDISSFNENNLTNNLSNWFYTTSGIAKDNIYSFDLIAESEYADIIINEVNEIMENPCKYINEEAFERLKKTWYAFCIRNIDDPNYLADVLMFDILKYRQIVDYHAIIDSLNYQELEKIMRELDLSKKTLILMLPNNKK